MPPEAPRCEAQVESVKELGVGEKKKRFCCSWAVGERQSVVEIFVSRVAIILLSARGFGFVPLSAS